MSTHELTHLVSATATANPYNGPPTWLNEGLAQYLAVGYQASDRAEVEAAVADGRIIPLTALGGLFPTSRDPFYLAYAESVAAVDKDPFCLALAGDPRARRPPASDFPRP